MYLLPQLIESVNFKGKFNELIELARAGKFHDFKSDLAGPKVKLYEICNHYKELSFLAPKVLAGDFDDKADIDDILDMRKDLPEEMWATMGFWLEGESGYAAQEKAREERAANGD